jgi:purine-binding chemotaxis protein CheW
MKETNNDKLKFLTVKISANIFAIEVESIKDVLNMGKIVKVPLSPNHVMGLINIRGKIVLVIDIKPLLGIDGEYDLKKCMNIVLDHQDGAYSIIVDSVGSVINISRDEILENPESINENWQRFSKGIYTTQKELISIINIEEVLSQVE